MVTGGEGRMPVQETRARQLRASFLPAINEPKSSFQASRFLLVKGDKLAPTCHRKAWPPMASVSQAQRQFPVLVDCEIEDI